MAKTPKKPRDEGAEIDPRGGDQILKRMLKAKPKTHDEMVQERRAPVKAARSSRKGKKSDV